MGNRIESFKGFAEGYRRYIFFKNPPELHVGLLVEEDHRSILNWTKRDRSEISIAGALYKTEDTLAVNATGSWSLDIEERRPETVIDYIKSLSDSAGKKIKAG